MLHWVAPGAPSESKIHSNGLGDAGGTSLSHLSGRKTNQIETQYVVMHCDGHLLGASQATTLQRDAGGATVTSSNCSAAWLAGLLELRPSFQLPLASCLPFPCQCLSAAYTLSARHTQTFAAWSYCWTSVFLGPPTDVYEKKNNNNLFTEI